MKKIKRFGVEVQDNGNLLVVIEHKDGRIDRQVLNRGDTDSMLAAIETAIAVLQVKNSIGAIRGMLS